MALPQQVPEPAHQDNFDELDTRLTLLQSFGRWQTWTPTLTDLTLGNGTLTARYCQIGKVVHFRLLIVFGSTTAITGEPTFTLPVTADYSGNANWIIGGARLFDTSTSTRHTGVTVQSSATVAKPEAMLTSSADASRSPVSSTNPFTWTTNDEISVQGTYEAA